MNYFDSNNCGNSHHVFLRDDDDHIAAYHVTDSDGFELCERAEFNFADMLEGDVDRVLECPWCLRRPVDQEHIRKCTNYKVGYSEAEIRDCYSDPTDAAKRERMLQ